MKRIGLLTTVALFTVALLAGTASAQGTSPDWANKAGAIGIGGNTSLGGSNGILFRTYVTPQLGLHLTFGFGFESVTHDDPESTIKSNYFDVGVYGSYKLAYWQRGHLSLIFGFDLQTAALKTEVGGVAGTDDPSAIDFLIGVGIMGEYFPTQYLSLFVQAGFKMDFLQEDERYNNPETGLPDIDEGAEDRGGIQMQLSSDLWGSAGFTVWFN